MDVDYLIIELQELSKSGYGKFKVNISEGFGSSQVDKVIIVNEEEFKFIELYSKINE